MLLLHTSVMSEHKFKIGQRLFPARSVGMNVPDGAYVVVKRLPKHDGEFEYQIKSVSGIDERIMRELMRLRNQSEISRM